MIGPADRRRADRLAGPGCGVRSRRRDVRRVRAAGPGDARPRRRDPPRAGRRRPRQRGVGPARPPPHPAHPGHRGDRHRCLPVDPHHPAPALGRPHRDVTREHVAAVRGGGRGRHPVLPARRVADGPPRPRRGRRTRRAGRRRRRPGHPAGRHGGRAHRGRAADRRRQRARLRDRDDDRRGHRPGRRPRAVPRRLAPVRRHRRHVRSAGVQCARRGAPAGGRLRGDRPDRPRRRGWVGHWTRRLDARRREPMPDLSRA